jgi:hypothetical protein
MGGTLDYSTTAGSNTTVGGVSIAEGMTPGGVNNGMRAMMADSRKWQLDWSGVTTAGSSNAYTMTSNQGIAAYADGQRFSFRSDRNNTGAATLNIDTRGAKSLRKVTGGALAALVADDLVEKAIYDVVYISADDVFVIVGINLSLTGLGITATAAELNHVDGVTSAIQTQLDAKQAAGATLTSLEGLSLAEGDILYATAADTLVRLPKGTDGQVLVLASGLPSWGAAGLSEYFESAEQTIADAGSRTIAHGLSAEPKLVQAVLVCKSAEHGYSIGDKVFLNPSGFGDLVARGFSLVPDSTNLNVRYAANGIGVVNKSAGTSNSVTPASWRLVLRAWA